MSAFGVDADVPVFNELRRELVDALLMLSGMDRFETRSDLLRGLEQISLSRSQSDARTDLNGIVVGLGRVGRLLDRGGTRPLIVLIDNALERVPETVELGAKLRRIGGRLADLYGGDIQPLPKDVHPEALVFGLQRDARLPIDFLVKASQTTRSVARLAVPRIFGGQRRGKELVFGTGWLIAPRLLITNHHVIEARDRRPKPLGLGESPAEPSDLGLQAEAIELWFDYHQEQGGRVECLGAKLLVLNEELDYAVLEISEGDKIADRQSLPLLEKRPSLSVGDRINIVQHAGGGPMRLAIRNNFYVKDGRNPDFIQYQTDTEGGASGSPVCDDQWRVIALHHASISVPPQKVPVPQEVLAGQPVQVRMLNEAITISAILDSLPMQVREKIMV